MTLIRNPLNYVRSRNQSTCVVCDSEWVTTYSHSKWPGMDVCAECLSTIGGWHRHPADSKDHLPAWETIATYIGRHE